MKRQTEQLINEMVRRIVERFHPEKVILFGSYARGTAGADSDVDLLVVMRVRGSKRKAQLRIRIVCGSRISLKKNVRVFQKENSDFHLSGRSDTQTLIHLNLSQRASNGKPDNCLQPTAPDGAAAETSC